MSSAPPPGWTDLLTSIHVTTALLYLLILLTIFSITKRWFFLDNHLPGPLNIPILGNLYVIMFNPTNFIAVLTKMAKIYGNAYSFRMGAIPAVVVCGYDAVKEILVNQGKLFSERPLLGYMVTNPEELGIFFQNGERWTYLRKLTHRTLYDVNTVKPENISRIIKKEMNEMVTYITSLDGKAFDPKEMLGVVVANVLSSVMWSRRYHYNDKRVKEMLDDVNRSFEIEGFGQMEHFIPSLRYLKHLGIGTSYLDEILRLRRKMKAFILDECCTSQLQKEDKATVENMADAFRKRYNGEREDIDDIICLCLLDMILAGTAAAKSAVSWITVYTTRFPQIADCCRKEIQQVYGDSQAIFRPHELPYTNSTLHEILRMSSVVPTTAPHMASEDTTLNGYPVEKGTLILVNLHSVNNEKETWGDPEVFRPSRFLDTEGKFIRNNKLLTFGAGPRSCLGKAIAKRLIFHFFVTLLTKFDLQMPADRPLPDLDGVLRITMEPKPFQLCAIPRHKLAEVR